MPFLSNSVLRVGCLIEIRNVILKFYVFSIFHQVNMGCQLELHVSQNEVYMGKFMDELHL